MALFEKSHLYIFVPLCFIKTIESILYVVKYTYIKSALLKMIPRITTTECMLVLGFCVK